MQQVNMSDDLKDELSKRGLKFSENGEILHDGPLYIPQKWEDYTPEDHETWEFLFNQQFNNLQDIAYTHWLNAMSAIGLKPGQIPRLIEIAQLTIKMTKWLPVPVSGFLDAHDYFVYLSKRQFPTVVSLRKKENWEFQVDPDLFHDAFGHLPMHSEPVFADFLQLFGEAAAKAKNLQQTLELSRLYWFTVEYGLIKENGKIKVCGSGHMSGFKESRYSLTDAVIKRPFKLEEVVAQDFNPHVLQNVLFVLDSYEQLYEAMQKKVKEFGIEL